LGIEEFLLQDLQLFVVKPKLELQGSIGHPAALTEQVYHLVEHRIEFHR
jgi:hypothetical protein